MRKRLHYVFIGLILIAGESFAQPPNYAFQPAGGTYIPLVGGTVAVITSGDFDDGFSNGIPIGFTFNYNSTNYTTISASANGWTALGTNITVTSSTTNLTSAANRPKLAPLYEDIHLGTNSNLTYATTGVAGTRIFTLQWANVLWDFAALSPSISFQIRLYEGNNIIEFIYNQEAGNVELNSSGGAAIGITTTATGSGSFLSLSDAGSNPFVSTTVETTNIGVRPASGQIYRWIPYCSAAATNTTGEKISNFTYNTINNNSSSTGVYENFSNIVTTVSLFPNSTLPFSATVSSFIPTDEIILFIDFNHNGDFNDPGETVFTSSLPLSSGTVTGNITVPALSSTVLQGRTRLRIRLHDSGTGPNSSSCGPSTSGQVEDYSIDIQPCFAAAITTQPANTIICNAGNGSVTVATTGTGLTYQWQVSTNGGTSYTNLTNAAPYSGTTTNTLNITAATPSMNSYLYKVVINGTCTAPNLTSSAAMLTMNTPAAITSSPANSSVCERSSATFTAAASGSLPSYQWQVSTDGGMNYSNVANANSTTLNFSSVSNNMSLNRYKAVVSVIACGSVTSGAAILKVNPLPEVTLTSAPNTQIQPGITTTLFATSNPTGVTYSWALDGSVIPGAAASTYVANITGLGKYKATITDINGCTNTTEELALTALPSNRLFIYPNPTPDGIFHVRLSIPSLPDFRTITVYNSAGAVVARQTFTARSPYQEATFDFRGIAAGIYTVEVKHQYTNIVAVGKVIIR